MVHIVLRPSLALALALASAVLVVSLGSTALAQSGRRPPARRPEPPPAPAETTPAPAPAPEAEAEGPQIPITAGTFSMSFNLPNAVCDYVSRACIDRFKSAKGYKVMAGGEMNRKKAVELAKTATDTYVLLMEFSLDAADSERASMGPADLRNVIVAYSLYTPQTGKVRTQGRIYFDASQYYTRNGGVLGTYSRLGRTHNYTPDEAGQKVAEYVMDSLLTQTPAKIPVPR